MRWGQPGGLGGRAGPVGVGGGAAGPVSGGGAGLEGGDDKKLGEDEIILSSASSNRTLFLVPKDPLIGVEVY